MIALKRRMEETRAGATNVVVKNELGGFVSDQHRPAEDDDVVVLSKLKKMLDAGLIEQAEYDSKKREILEKM